MSVCVLIGQRFRWVEKRIWKWGEGHEGKNKKLRVGKVKGKNELVIFPWDYAERETMKMFEQRKE